MTLNRREFSDQNSNFSAEFQGKTDPEGGMARSNRHLLFKHISKMTTTGSLSGRFLYLFSAGKFDSFLLLQVRSSRTGADVIPVD